MWVMPKVPCHPACTKHLKLVSRWTRLRCIQAISSVLINPASQGVDANVGSRRVAMDAAMDLDADMDATSAPNVTLDLHNLNEVDALCLRLYATRVQSGQTEDTVTQTLETIRDTIGSLLPPHLLHQIPHSFDQLERLFQENCHDILRVPCCPMDCMLALNEEKKCSECKRRLFQPGKRLPIREFTSVHISDVMRSHRYRHINAYGSTGGVYGVNHDVCRAWWDNGIIAKLLRYPTTYKKTGMWRDVLDGTLWNEVFLPKVGN